MNCNKILIIIFIWYRPVKTLGSKGAKDFYVRFSTVFMNFLLENELKIKKQSDTINSTLKKTYGRLERWKNGRSGQRR